MSGKRKGYNWESRANKSVIVDNSTTREIKIDTSVLGEAPEGDELVLPSKKRKTTKLKEAAPKKKVLSKKERRKLQAVVDRRKKKEKRSEILDALSKVQIPEHELKMMISTQQMQSKSKTKEALAIRSTDTPMSSAVNMIKGARRSQKPVVQETSDLSSSDCEITTTDEEGDDEPNKNSPSVDAGDHTDGRPDAATVEDTQVIASDATNDGAKDVNTLPMNPAGSSLLHQLNKGILVERDEQIQAARLKLPILAEEQVVMETISENLVTIICGETGSGKTTQIPQFLYEAGYTSDNYMIGVTEPRRVAAISMSKRVAQELNLSERQVSFQIRYEGNTTPETCIKFMTDGVLLKEIQNDFLLDKYRAVIIDEAHERSIYTDVLIGLLSRIVNLRHKKGKSLKLIIMSATLRVEDFRDNSLLFSSPPPVIKINSRQYPVTVHFNKRTSDDYLTDAFKKICKIHRQLPPGGILVFVTGKQEVHTLCKKLRSTFPARPVKQSDKDSLSEPSCKDSSISSQSKHVKASFTQDEEPKIPEVKLDNYSALPSDEQAELQPGDDSDIELPTYDEDNSGEDDDVEEKVFSQERQKADQRIPLHVLPLYSLLNSKKQSQVFEPPPEGCRLCVISTNVAETSLTIPNVKYVVDTGKTKNKFYDKVTGVSTFRVTFTSQASANQRAGRAGRTGPGHCYRLYSSSVFTNELEKFSEPEITSRPVDDLVLQMKAMGIDRVVNFPFPTPPSAESLQAAQDLLVKLGALEVKSSLGRLGKKGQVETTITSLGRTMSMFPVAPRYAKMISLAHQSHLLEFIIAIVSGCSVEELFMEGSLGVSDTSRDETKTLAQAITRQKAIWAGKGQSMLLGDVMVLLKAVGATEFAGATPSFCEQHGLRYKAIKEIRKLRVQLTNIVNSVLPSSNICVNPHMSPPTEEQVRMIRQILLAGLGDHVARLNIVPNDAEPDVKKKMRNSYQSTLVDDLCYLHPTSVLHKKNPEYVVYQDIIEANDKVYLRGVAAIEPEWLPVYTPSRCKFSEPQEEPSPRFDTDTGSVLCHMSSTFGPHSWQLPTVELPYPNKIERYRWFAKALLEGKVVDGIEVYLKSYLAAPSIMIKSWARLQPRTESLLTALHSKRVSNREALLRVWRNNATYLLAEILEWLPESIHGSVASAWPPASHTNDDSSDTDID